MVVCVHPGRLVQTWLFQGVRGLDVILLIMHGLRVGLAVSHFLQLLIEVRQVQLLPLLAGKVGGKNELGPENLLVWSRCGRALWPSKIIGSLLDQSLSLWRSQEMAFLSL